MEVVLTRMNESENENNLNTNTNVSAEWANVWAASLATMTDGPKTPLPNTKKPSNNRARKPETNKSKSIHPIRPNPSKPRIPDLVMTAYEKGARSRPNKNNNNNNNNNNNSNSKGNNPPTSNRTKIFSAPKPVVVPVPQTRHSKSSQAQSRAPPKSSRPMTTQPHVPATQRRIPTKSDSPLRKNRAAAAAAAASKKQVKQAAIEVLRTSLERGSDVDGKNIATAIKYLPEERKKFLLKMLEDVEFDLNASNASIENLEALKYKNDSYNRSGSDSDDKKSENDDSDCYQNDEFEVNSRASPIMMDYGGGSQHTSRQQQQQPSRKQQQQQQKQRQIAASRNSIGLIKPPVPALRPTLERIALALVRVKRMKKPSKLFPPTRRRMVGPASVLELVSRDLQLYLSSKEVDLLINHFDPVQNRLLDYCELVELGRRFLRADGRVDQLENVALTEKDEKILFKVKQQRENEKKKEDLLKQRQNQQMKQMSIHGAGGTSPRKMGDKYRDLLEKIAVAAQKMKLKNEKAENSSKENKDLNSIGSINKRVLVAQSDFRKRLVGVYKLKITPIECAVLEKQFNLRSDGLVDLKQFEHFFYGIGNAAKTRARKYEAQEQFIKASSKGKGKKVVEAAKKVEKQRVEKRGGGGEEEDDENEEDEDDSYADDFAEEFEASGLRDAVAVEIGPTSKDDNDFFQAGGNIVDDDEDEEEEEEEEEEEDIVVEEKDDDVDDDDDDDEVGVKVEVEVEVEIKKVEVKVNQNKIDKKPKQEEEEEEESEDEGYGDDYEDDFQESFKEIESVEPVARLRDESFDVEDSPAHPNSEERVIEARMPQQQQATQKATFAVGEDDAPIKKKFRTTGVMKKGFANFNLDDESDDDVDNDDDNDDDDDEPELKPEPKPEPEPQPELQPNKIPTRQNHSFFESDAHKHAVKHALVNMSKVNENPKISIPVVTAGEGGPDSEPSSPKKHSIFEPNSSVLNDQIIAELKRQKKKDKKEKKKKKEKTNLKKKAKVEKEMAMESIVARSRNSTSKSNRPTSPKPSPEKGRVEEDDDDYEDDFDI
ncbi:hypothetical protein ScalyP_jg6287 [Parmales sp. scaly parma]|nr:hypothetical protein ScalyP_jg6287 [Parmales sp. scaly parma]